jgi:hypothetical protein
VGGLRGQVQMVQGLFACQHMVVTFQERRLEERAGLRPAPAMARS